MATDLSSPSIAGCTLDKALTNKIRRDCARCSATRRNQPPL